MHSQPQRLPWQLTCLLLASVASAAILPSNTSTADQRFQGVTLPLKHADGDAPIATLIPLTRGAVTRTFQGDLYYTNYSNTVNITVGQIAFISCNPADYPGYVDPQRVFQDAFRKANISGVILYSTATDYCSYQATSNQDMLNDFPMLSMTNKSDSAALLNATDDLPVNLKYFVKVVGRGDNGTNPTTGFSQSNPLGPSPSTAVAMIILYSITGIITALFLVIIITGAIRAHRHPERYGPRDVLGRPRQTRARGLGRAILDTIPIVKFGEKEPAKPTDVELASTAEAGDVSRADGAGEHVNHATAATEATAKSTTTTTETPQQTTVAPEEDHQEGIAPAQAVAPAVVASGKVSSSNEENLGCSICTEDFEKGQDLRVLPCNHKFHSECVDPWLLNVSGTCPLCRVDLRPVTSHESSEELDDLQLNAEAEASTSRRRTVFREFISLRHRPNATPEERIYALRRLREQQRRDATAAANASTEDGGDRRRSRMSARLSGVFSGRRRDRSPAQQGESGRIGGQQVQRDTSPTREMMAVAMLAGARHM